MADIHALFAIALSALLSVFALSGDFTRTPSGAEMPAAHWLATSTGDQPAKTVDPDHEDQTAGLLLKRSPDGFFFATASLNGVPTRLMVDTGANTMVLRKEDADRAGLTSTGSVRMQTVGGEVRARKTRIAAMALGNGEARDVDAVIVDDHIETSLIGTKALAQFGPVILDGTTLAIGPAS